MDDKKVSPSMFVSEVELSLIKSAFYENEELLKLLRNLFFGLELTQEEKQIIRNTFKSDELKNLLKKRMLPTINKDLPFEQSVDLWTGIDMVGKSPLEISQTIKVRFNMIKLMEMALALLDNPDGERPNIAYNPDYVADGDEFGIALTTRNRFIGHIVFHCNMLKVISEQKLETEEQKTKRLAKNSTQ